MLKRFSLLISALLFSGTVFETVQADVIFKRKVIDKCDEAKLDLARLDRDKQIGTVEDLKLVLKLDLSAFDATNPDLKSQINKIPAMNGSMESMKGEDYWRTFQPDREIKAKFCALEILKSLSPHSISALPEMIELTQNYTLPHNFQNLLYEVIQNIVLDAVNDPNFTVPEEIIDRLILMLDKPYNYYAQNALMEMHAASLPKLYQKMMEPDGKFRQLITDTLLRLDQSGEIIGSGALVLLESSDDGLRKRAINILLELENFYSFSLPAIIDLLVDISSDVQESAFNALDHIFSRLKEVPKISLGEESINILFKKFLTSDGRKRHTLTVGLNKLLIFNESFEKRIIEAFKTEDPELKADLIGILAGDHKPSPQLKSFLYKALKDPNSIVRLKAIQVINSAKLQNASSNSFLLRLLDDPNQGVRSQAELEVIGLNKNIAPELLKFFKTKSVSEKNKLLRLMVRITPEDKEVAALFEANIKKQSCDGKANLTILAAQMPKKLKSQLSKDLSACLAEVDSDYSLVSEALAALAPFEREDKESLLKIINSESVSGKALIFILLNSKKLAFSDDELSALIKKLLKVDDKTIKFRTISYLNSLEGVKLPLTAELLQFQKENSDDDILSNEAVIALSRINESAFDIETFFIKEIEGDKYQWAEKYIDKLSPEMALKIIRRSLESLPVSKKSIAITMAGNYGKNAADMLPKIKEHLEAPDLNLYYAAAVALIKIDPLDPLAAENLRRLLFREISQQLLKEDFNNSVLPLLDKLKATSTSFVERRMLDLLREKVSK
jgi:hypothetical protein